jgi:hypothetical protein
MTLGWPRPKRLKHLGELKPGKTHEVLFQGRRQQLPKHVVPLELPKYRLANGRTRAKQKQYIATHPGTSEEFFKKDPESDAAQSAQHEILKELISEKKLHFYFKKEEQQESLILTPDGFVLNGNRRLCSWRQHFYSNQSKYKQFKNIEVVILPPCDSKDIDELEAELQIKQDIKADYLWVATSCLLRDKREEGHTDPELARIYAMSESDVKEKIDLLDEADSYLTFLKKPRQYDLVSDKDYAFRSLIKERRKINDLENKEKYAQICYLSMDTEEGGRLYDKFKRIQQYLPKIMEELSQALPKSKRLPKSKPTKASALLGSPRKSTQRVPDLSAHKAGDTVKAIVQDVLETQKATKKDKHNAGLSAKKVKEARQALTQAVDAISPRSVLDSIADDLRAITALIKKLYSSIKRRR